jgi:fructosamine-3-kinase
MVRLPGVRLHAAKPLLDEDKTRRLERERRETVARLRAHEGDSFGGLTDERRFPAWADCFEAQLTEEREADRRLGLVGAESPALVERLVPALPKLPASPERPRLVHGALRATNLMVRPEGPSLLSGFLDPVGIFASREYELAYPEIRRTVGPAFFAAYFAVRPPPEGYSLRRNVYRLHTPSLRVRFFKDLHCVESAERTMAESGARPLRRISSPVLRI